MLAALVACGGIAVATLGHGAPKGAAAESARRASPTYYGDVKPILDGRCVTCHTIGGIAPFPLTSYAAAASRRIQIARVVARRVMPPWHADRGYRGYLHDPSLTEAQIDAIRRWAAADAPRGAASRAGKPLPPVGGGLSRVDARLTLPTYTPQQRVGHDDYRCFVVPWDRPTSHVTGFDAVPGHRREVHHMLVYLAAAADAATVDAWDASDPAPGYSCYGGPSAGGRTLIAVQPLGGWVPGFQGGDFPSGTGVRIGEGSRVIVQVHYNLDAARPAPDRSLVRLKLDETVAKRAFTVPVLDLRWLLAPRTFTIPAANKRVVHTFSGDVALQLRFVGADRLAASGFAIHGVTLHMHRLGTRGQLVLERPSGAREVLLSIRNWDFDWQRGYQLAEPVLVSPGDRLAVRCEHDNSRANQPVIRGKRGSPRTVTWGENSSDEMCLGFLFVSEP